jgi:hypothetical protein
MRKFIPILLVTATVLAGCSTPATVHTQNAGGTNATASFSMTVGTNAVVGTNAAVAAAVSAEAAGHVNSPSETMSENVMLGDLGAAFLVLLPIILCLRRS